MQKCGVCCFSLFQISDIHISIFHDKSRVTELKEFCDLTLNAIKPTVVLASGMLLCKEMKGLQVSELNTYPEDTTSSLQWLQLKCDLYPPLVP